MLIEGMFIADRYEVIGKIGAGGMSDVYKAKDLMLGRFVAIKVLKQEFSEELNFVTKFRTEAQAAAGLEHPNIVNIYDVGSERGLHYIVMEYVEGVTLKTYIEKKGQLSYKEAASIAIQVGRGIEAAHAKGIIHRDIKPQNIMISTEGKVKVTDFGIARAATSNTINSDVMGSVHYSSPEQARNGFVDGKSDIYSMGVVLYEMVTGRVPFDGDTTVAVAIQHLQEEMIAPSVYAPGLPISMEKIILKCTQKNPDRRYETMTALLADLRKVLISPNEDFVVMTPFTNQDKTRIIGEDDLDQIKRETGRVHVRPEPMPVQRKAEKSYREDDEIEDEEDGELNPKMEKAITIMGIVAAVVIVIIIICLLVSLFGGFGSGKKNNTTTPKQTESQTAQTTQTENTQQKQEGTIEVPNVKGNTYDEAKAKLNAAGLGIQQIGTAASDEYSQGQIIGQNIEAGSMVAPNTTIEVTVSSGKGEIEIPSVKAKKEADAIRELENAGFIFEKKYSYSDTVEEGYVISQTPEGKGKEGDKITIEISQGKAMITIPSLIAPNYTDEATAKKKLEGLNVIVKTAYSEDIYPGLVMEQSIAPGNKVTAGSDITLTVSLGPAPAQNVTAATYAFNQKINVNIDATKVSGANVALYDANGNQVKSWPNQPLSALNGTTTYQATGILTEKGTLKLTWLDMNGSPLNTQEQAVTFTKES